MRTLRSEYIIAEKQISSNIDNIHYRLLHIPLEYFTVNIV